MRFLSLAFFLLFACSNPPYRGREVCGPDDFVIDSYQIREGKYAILGMGGRCFDSLDETLLNEYETVIQNGDLLYIQLHHPTRGDLSQTIAAIGGGVGFRVDGGKIRLPDLEPIEVAGLNLKQAEERIESAYRSEIDDVEIYLSFREKGENKVELIGMISSSTLPVDGKKRLFEVLAQAKVSPDANFFKSYVVRNGKLLPVDLYKLVKEGDMSQNIVMRGADKIYIADRAASTIAVLGEVGKQQMLDVPNGFMTLRQAIGMAGGISLAGDLRYIQVIRGSILNPKIYTLNWEHLIRLPSDSLLLIPGDIVYVAATPIARWDRFVNQVLPTLVGLDLIMRGAKGVGVIVP